MRGDSFMLFLYVDHPQNASSPTRSLHWCLVCWTKNVIPSFHHHHHHHHHHTSRVNRGHKFSATSNLRAFWEVFIFGRACCIPQCHKKSRLQLQNVSYDEKGFSWLVRTMATELGSWFKLHSLQFRHSTTIFKPIMPVINVNPSYKAL